MMPNFSRKSLDQLRTLDGRLQRILCEAIKYYDFIILEGIRTIERQKELVEQGKSQTMNSYHLPISKNPWSRAVDIAPYPIDWEDTNRFCELAGYIKRIAKEKGFKITWGGDWKTLKDMPHFQVEES